MDGLKAPVIVIPALEPEEALITLVRELTPSFRVVVVDDGSRPTWTAFFKMLEGIINCTVLHHPGNQGKGAALKTAMRYILSRYPDCTGVVTADADGQHLPVDVARVAAALSIQPGALVLGVRSFSGREVPWKSRWGNWITSGIFLLSAGRRCPDTQTGLRGISSRFLPQMLEIPGNRYEYEMNQLLTLARQGVPVRQVPITAVYLDRNRSSHFRAVRDSLRIYGGILKFALSSGFSAIVDFCLFALADRMLPVFQATIAARLVSGGVNFLLNRNWVFEYRGNSALLKYGLLFCCQMLASGLLVAALASLCGYPLAAKLLVDSCLFLISYRIQKEKIFTTCGRSMNA